MYRIAPHVKFPTPLNDVINGYLAIVSTFSKKLDKIIMFGDSAGACLISGTVNYLLVNELRLPDKLMFLYPALVCNLNYFCPSILKSYNDEMINFFHLQYVLMLYLGNDNCLFLSID